MPTTTIFLLILAVLVSALISGFQYFYRSGKRTSKNALFAGFRFLSLFCLLLLIINPKIKRYEYYTQKADLAVLVDNSASIEHFEQEQEVQDYVQNFRKDRELNGRFSINYYSFGRELNQTESFSFKESQSNISEAIKGLENLYREKTAPTVLITDGNQTQGEDFAFVASGYDQNILPVVVGDTNTYRDLEISRLNVNRYAFLKNWFPVEVFVSYSGKEEIKTRLQIRSGGVSLYSEDLALSPEKNSVVVQTKLPSVSIGVNSYELRLRPLPDEKNISNNNVEFAVEVIDERSEVLLVYSKLHPDLGALKKAIESNQYRQVVIRHISEVQPKDLNSYELLVLFEPDASFNIVLNQLKEKNENYWIIAGPETDWRFLNREQELVQQEITNQTEEYFPVLNESFSAFQVDDPGFKSFPPLMGSFGKSNFSEAMDVLLYRQVQAIKTQEPLLAVVQKNEARKAFLMGTDIWKWRSQVFVENNSFEAFDDFIGRLVQYLSSSRKKDRLSLDYRPLYRGSEDLILRAEYFDNNYQFDPRAEINLRLENESTGEVQQIPFMLNENQYRVDLRNIEPGNYRFTASVEGENISKSGSFRLLEFKVEMQFVNANTALLKTVAENRGQELYNLQNFGKLKKHLLEDDSYVPVQKRRENTVPLIDWFYLLIIIILSLSAEWFLRKYYGYI